MVVYYLIINIIESNNNQTDYVSLRSRCFYLGQYPQSMKLSNFKSNFEQIGETVRRIFLAHLTPKSYFEKQKI